MPTMKWQPLTHPEYIMYSQHTLLLHTCMHLAICKSILCYADLQAVADCCHGSTSLKVSDAQKTHQICVELDCYAIDDV